MYCLLYNVTGFTANCNLSAKIIIITLKIRLFGAMFYP